MPLHKIFNLPEKRKLNLEEHIFKNSHNYAGNTVIKFTGAISIDFGNIKIHLSLVISLMWELSTQTANRAHDFILPTDICTQNL